MYTHTHTHTHIYIYIYIGIMSRVFANARSSYIKVKKMVLDAALLNTQQYKVRIKGKGGQSREWSRNPSTPWCSTY